MTLHHHPHYIAAAGAERHARAAERRSPADAGELGAVVLGARRGDSASWNVLVARFTARVRAVALRHRLASHDVDDVLQTTWMRLFEHLESVREPAAVGAWLETTARRESLRVVARAEREQPTDDAFDLDRVSEPIGERELVAAERRLALVASLERLTPRQRSLVDLLLSSPSLSYAEIAKALDAPIGSIGPTRARLLARLRRDPELIRAIGQGG